MDFSLSEDQAMFKDTVGRILDKEYQSLVPNDAARHSADAIARRWGILAENGVLGLPFVADASGMEQGAVGSMLALEEIGRNLASEPYLASVVLAGTLLQSAGETAYPLVAEIAEGAKRASLAIEEDGMDHDFTNIATSAKKDGDLYVLNGKKRLVLDGDNADILVVVARTSGKKGDVDGLSTFVIDANADGITKNSYGVLDGNRAADFDFNNAKATLVGEEGKAAPRLEQVYDAANAAIAAEMTGLVGALIDITCEYIKVRQQFGVPLAKFQVLTHRLVDARTEWELLKSAAGAAAMGFDDLDGKERRVLCSAAKVQAIRAGRFAHQQAIQLHGGIGMTEECHVGWYAKRIILLSQIFGDESHHIYQFTQARAA